MKKNLIKLFAFFFVILFASPVLAEELFWEYPRILIPENAFFPLSASNDGVAAIAWQEYRYITADVGSYSLSLVWRNGNTGSDWTTIRNFAGPYAFAGREVGLSSLCVDRQGTIFVAISINSVTTVIFRKRTSDTGFAETDRVVWPTTALTPRLSVKADGGLILFTTLGQTVSENNTSDILRIFYCMSNDGATWSQPSALIGETLLGLSFTPSHLAMNGKDYVVFQSLTAGETNQLSYQLFLTSSANGGRTWSSPVWITGFEEFLGGNRRQPAEFNNQRAHLISDPATGEILLTWERSLGRQNPMVYFARLSATGVLSGTPEALTIAGRSSRAPRLFRQGSDLYAVWFDNRSGINRIYLARHVPSGGWEETELTGSVSGVNTFPDAFSLGGRVSIIWQSTESRRDRLVLLDADRTSAPVSLEAVNFAAGRRSRLSSISARWALPNDSSGTVAYAWAWDRSPETTIPQQRMLRASERTLDLEADADGAWYLHVTALDRAGNWSAPAVLSYQRDLTPPNPISFEDLPLDENGYLPNNNISIQWVAPDATDLGGYSYSLQYLAAAGAAADPASLPLNPPPLGILTRTTSFYYRNQDNGLWALSVAPIDDIGNRGETRTLFFRLNKYVPETYITWVQTSQDETGVIRLSVLGRGFMEGGTVDELILDRDGQAPYDDYVFPADPERFLVSSDRSIDNAILTDVESGSYWLGVRHPTRGVAFAPQRLSFDVTGTVKYGDFRPRAVSPFSLEPRSLFSFDADSALVWAVVLFLCLVMLYSIRKVFEVVNEGRALRSQVEGILSGRFFIEDGKKTMKELRKKGLGLRAKFAFFIIMLILIVVLLIALPLGLFMINTQQQSLASALEQRANLMLETISSGAENYLIDKDALNLGLLVSQAVNMPEVLSATITGVGINDPVAFNYIWATTDATLLQQIQGDYGTMLLPDDEATAPAAALTAEIERLAADETTGVAGLMREVQRLTTEARQFDLQTQIEYSNQIDQLGGEISTRLRSIGDVTGSYPVFDAAQPDLSRTSYLFFKPIVYRDPNSSSPAFVRGLVRLNVSTDRIRGELTASRNGLIERTGLYALLTTAIGVLGTFLLASIIILPIRKLVRGVELIRDTSDKSQLKDHVISITSRDEIAQLAETVNQMTQGLVKAANASKDLTVGKEVQKMFIPLEKDSMGRKLTTGRNDTPRCEFFGYYEGAKGVSGDYFDFMRLDERRFAVIKCDVAGKGVPAALIMVEVATIFLNYFKDWSFKREGIHLEKLVYKINDLLEERGFKGRFAALTVCIYDEESGTGYFCNAGDNIFHYYDAAEGHMKSIQLPKAPAAGVFPSSLIEMQSGFKQLTFDFKRNDLLLLLTDGVEEAKRNFRDASANPIVCRQEGLKEGDAHDNHQFGTGDEEFGMSRIQEIIRSVYSRGRFRLMKNHNPIENEDLDFDFSWCQGTAEEAVMALVSVEKVFRVYPDSAATNEDMVVMDRKIDEFLKKSFLQYHAHFTQPEKHPEYPEYVLFRRLKEDEQYDDLTILGIRKK